MHIAVTLKQVHDPNTPAELLRVGDDGRTLSVRAGASSVINGYDANAVEAAIRIKETLGTPVQITVVSIGDADAVTGIRRAIAMGADAGLHVQGASGLTGDSFFLAELLAAAIRGLDGVDLVLCGKAASDTDAGQTHLILAEKLGLAAVSPIREVTQVNTDAVDVWRMGDGYSQHIRAKLPCLLGVSNEINKPRAPALKGVALAKRVMIPSVSAEALGLAPDAAALTLKQLSITPPQQVTGCVINTGSDADNGRALAERLVAEGVLA